MYAYVIPKSVIKSNPLIINSVLCSAYVIPNSVLKVNPLITNGVLKLHILKNRQVIMPDFM
jgi:hypothetical protein